MEGDKLEIKKSYVYTGIVILVLLFGYSIYSLGSANSGARPRQQINQMIQMSGSMEDHHKPVSEKSSGLFNNAVGKQAPDFELQDINGNVVKLSDFKGKNVVLFFNEGSMCYPSCWSQIEKLSDDSRLNNDEVVSFSIVVDSRAQWQNIMQKAPQMSKSQILFDTQKQVSIGYDVLYAPSSMHKGSYPGHSYFIIDKQGIIRYVLDDPRMGLHNDEISAELGKIGV